MCETGHADGCTNPDAFLTETNRIGNPARTAVTLGACPDHLAEAITDQLRNNRRLGEQGMPMPPGTHLGHRIKGVTVYTIAPADDDRDDIADDAALSRIESSACDR